VRNRLLHRGELGVQTARKLTVRLVRLQRRGDLPLRCIEPFGGRPWGEPRPWGARPPGRACMRRKVPEPLAHGKRKSRPASPGGGRYSGVARDARTFERAPPWLDGID